MSEDQPALELPLGRQLAVLGRYYYGALTKKLSHLDIDRYYSLLLLLEQAETPVTQQMLGDQLHIDKASMVRVVDGMTEKGYIRRDVNPCDRRCHHISLTEQGKAILPEIRTAVAELNQAVMHGLSQAEINQFNHVLQLMATNLKGMPADEIQIEYSRKQKENPSPNS